MVLPQASAGPSLESRAVSLRTVLSYKFVNPTSQHLLPGCHRQRIVPRYYLSYYANGLAQGVGEFLVGGADGLAEDFVGPAGVVAEGGDGFGQVFGEGDGVRFAWE
jgi:hypothetical protein